MICRPLWARVVSNHRPLASGAIRANGRSPVNMGARTFTYASCVSDVRRCTRIYAFSGTRTAVRATSMVVSAATGVPLREPAVQCTAR